MSTITPPGATRVAAVIPASATSLPFTARGPLSDAVLRLLTGSADPQVLDTLASEVLERVPDVIRDDDVQLTLFALYASAYGAFAQLDPSMEWDLELTGVRSMLERALESALREEIPVPEVPAADADAVARALFALTAAAGGPSLARHVAKRASIEQVRELLVHRSVYTLREADPHSWAIPRLHGRAKAALVEIQADEYGGGRPDRMHAVMFAATMRGAGLDDTYGAYVDDLPALTLASHNLMSMFGLNRRLLGAIVGHLAAFEMTSSIPNRFYGDGFRRLGFGADVTDYFDEHVEADAVHEQIAGRDLAGRLAEDRPELIADLMFGAAACLAMDDWVADHLMTAWAEGRTSLRERS